MPDGAADVSRANSHGKIACKGSKGDAVTSPDQLAQQVRFHLDQLGENNAHHAFEQLCLGLSRRRLVSNVLPATGPVSGGGDGARDAETHWTYLPFELGDATSLFVALASVDRVVLACTSQKTGVPTKIKSDIETIATQGTPIQRVYYFTVTGVQVATRQRLIDEAQAAHGIALEIIDAKAIADYLVQPDLFYLAVSHLTLPAELAPPTDHDSVGLPDWYREERDRWRQGAQASVASGMINLRRALRYATFHDEARADLAEWLGFLRAFLKTVNDERLRLQAQYEIAVATLRGTNTLRPAEDLVRVFYDAAIKHDIDLGLLHDATVLLNYVQGAIFERVTDISPSQFVEWHTALRQKIDDLLVAGPFPNARASLHAMQARLALVPTYRVPLVDGTEGYEPLAMAMSMIIDAIDTQKPIESVAESPDLLDIDAGMAALEALLVSLESAPMFPIENTADLFDLQATYLSHHPAYASVRDRLDAAVEKLAGDEARGHRAQNRAFRFLEDHRLLDGLDEIQNAKINWWHGDTLEGSINMMLLASRIYRELGLPIAAKQYALAASVAANSSRQEELSHFAARGIVIAAACDWEAGCWLTSSYTFQIGVYAQGNLVSDPWDLEKHSYFSEMVTYQSLVLRNARAVRPSYLACIEPVIASTNLNEIVEPILAGVTEYPASSEQDLAQMADNTGMGRPFSDAGPTRHYHWIALGLDWDVATENTRQSVLAAERFVAAAQIVLAELARHDALLLAGRINVNIQTHGASDGGTEPRCTPVPDNDAASWVVNLTDGSFTDLEAGFNELVSTVVTVLIGSSLLSTNDFLDLVKTAFSKGLWHKLASTRPYDELANLINDDVYREFAALIESPPGQDLPRHPHSHSDELAPRTDPAPGYSREASFEAVANRYRRMLPIVQYTLPRLAADSAFRTIAMRLKGEGWLDWHLITAIANQVGNHRPAWNGIELVVGMSPRDQERVGRLMQATEQSTDPQLPAEDFTEERLRFHLNGSAMHAVVNLGLQVNQQTPNVDAILKFLGDRYNYWTDDVPHDDIFGWNSQSTHEQKSEELNSEI